MEFIEVRRANVHNLKNVDVKIPRHALTVITGPSGSGKSSLAFDTIYAEGQRRYIESLSSYARQFLGQMEPPDVESITGLSPAIAIDQKSTSKNPRSTVGTITEVYDYLRVLYARVGVPHCPESGEVLQAQSAQNIVSELLNLPQGSKLQLLAPIVRGAKGEHREMFAKYQSMGFARIRLNGQVQLLEDELSIDKNKKNNIEVIVDRLVIKDDVQTRLTDSVEQALKIGAGQIFVLVGEKELFFSEFLYSHKSGKSYPELEPRLFSFNSPLGACPACNGLGMSKHFHISKYILDENLSLADGAIGPLGTTGSFYYQMVASILKHEGASVSTPFKSWPKVLKDIVLKGSETIYNFSFKSENSSYKFKKSFPGIENWLQKKYEESNSDKVREELEEYMVIETCQSCEGKRLATYPLNVTINESSIMDICEKPIDEAYAFLSKIKLKGNEQIIAEKLLKEINARLKFLLDVGLNYLSLNRSAGTLSGGESQRIRLATQIGSALSGVIYVLDEPSIGLHQRDNDRLIKTLQNLRDLGNTVIVVEHDEDTMRVSDYIVDMGPGAGVHGGEVVAVGKLADILKKKKSITAKYLSGEEKIEVPTTRRKLTKAITINKIVKNNLKNLTLKVPLGGMICVTGVSGSGKSTLVHHALVPGVKNYLRKTQEAKACYHSIQGVNDIKSVIELDQSPIGRTPKSNPATYTKLFDLIRALFASTTEAKVRGYKQGRFSFNVKGGRCESCEGNGVIKVEMNFLPDVFITCDDCGGARYNSETLSVLYRGKNISDVLKMPVEEGLAFFSNHKKIAQILQTLSDVGLGYMQLGQSSTTLSGGEAQRLKLSRELAKSTKGHCLYVLDEPTTGLHFQDIKILLKALNALVEQGNTVLVIEHNLDVIKNADHVIDLGPEGGKAGGELVAEGSPEEVAKNKNSYTGQYLKKVLE